MQQSAMFFGGDYNPEQWATTAGYPDESTWLDDVRLMCKAYVNIVSLGIFSWTALQPSEDVFTFDWLDHILDLLAANDIAVCLGTATAAQPAWLSAAYPDVLPVTQWKQRREHGGRMNFCPTSDNFRRLARQLVRTLAERYRHHPALALWHVSNEYGQVNNEFASICYCDRCAERFQQWLQERYGALDELNARWVTSCWSHTYTSWQQILPPTPLGEQNIQGLTLDYLRFMSAMNLECFLEQAAILREVTPDVPLTTNFHGLIKSLDYHTWAAYQDVVSFDWYPRYFTHPSENAFYYDLMRSLGKGRSWLLMEQTPSQVQWHEHNPLKRPGMVRMHSYQAIAHGSNAAMFFQWRQARGSSEMYHGAIIGRGGHEHTRVFREVAQLGQELAALGSELIETRVYARVALLFSWPNWWIVESPHAPSSTLHYLDEAVRYYRALWQQHIAVDVISPDDRLDGYDVVVAPLLNMISEQQAQAIERYVEQGGTFLTTFFSGIVDEAGRAWLGDMPAPLRRTLGLWVEEFDPLPPMWQNSLTFTGANDGLQGTFSCMAWCDIVHTEGARTLATFDDDFYAGAPAITEHHLGSGSAIYVATQPEQACLEMLFSSILAQKGIAAPFPVPEGIELVQRQQEQRIYTFLLNHQATPQTIRLPQPMREMLTQQHYQQDLVLPAHGVAILHAHGEVDS